MNIRSDQRVRFSPYEFDLSSGTLFRSGTRLRLETQPSRILELLVGADGRMVTRSDIIEKLWPGEVQGDFDRRLDKAIAKLRASLNDNATEPQFIETIKGRGYRFLVQVEADAPAALEPEQNLIPGATEPPSPRSTRRIFLLALSIVLVITGGGAVMWRTLVRPASAPRVLRVRRLTQDGNVKTAPLLTDGERIYFREEMADGRSIIAQVSVNGGEVSPFPVPIPNPVLLDISKDRTELLIAGTTAGELLDDVAIGGPWNTPSSLWLQPVAGGPPHRIADVPSIAAGFGADGNTILYSHAHDIYSASLDGSSIHKLLTLDGYPGQVRLSPDGKSLHFTQNSSGLYTFALMGSRVDGTGLQKLGDGCCSQWTPDGRFLIFSKIGMNPADYFPLWALPRGDREIVKVQSAQHIQMTAGQFDNWIGSPSRDGTKIFSLAWSLRDELLRFDSHSHEFVPFLTGTSAEGVAFSPDGQWVVYTSYPDTVLWRSKADGSDRIQLTRLPLKAQLPRWSPDGKRIAFSGAMPMAVWNIYVVSSEGGAAQRMLPSTESQMDAAWSPDGKQIIFGSAQEPERSISVVDASSREVSSVPGSKGIFSPRWSPDGRYIAGVSARTNQLMLYDVSAQKWTRTTEQAVGFPVWSHDNKYIYFQFYPAPDKLYKIARLRLSDRKIEIVTELDKLGRLTNGTLGPWLGLTADDSPLLGRDISTFEIYALDMEWP